jgi:hypothetical protein
MKQRDCDRLDRCLPQRRDGPSNLRRFESYQYGTVVGNALLQLDAALSRYERR